MIHNFCTLFDSYYLSRGLAMHESLMKHGKSFHLYIFPFDDIAYRILSDLSLAHVSLVRATDFEDEDLLRVKPTRTKGEYCWTCTPSILFYCITKYNLPICTYLDADLYFFSDPLVLLDELGDHSILITDHRYSKAYDHAEVSGIYCVQFISFKNDSRGMLALGWWKDRCIEWCFNRLEDGKFGDQKYLDDWPQRFEGVHVLEHLGGGLAPWNVQRFQIDGKNSTYWISEQNQQSAKLVFYHFHWVKFLNSHSVDLGSYDLSFPFIHDIYMKWIQHIISIDKMLLEEFQFKVKAGKGPLLGRIKDTLYTFRRRWQGRYNVVDLKTFSISG